MSDHSKIEWSAVMNAVDRKVLKRRIRRKKRRRRLARAEADAILRLRREAIAQIREIAAADTERWYQDDIPEGRR